MCVCLKIISLHPLYFHNCDHESSISLITFFLKLLFSNCNFSIRSCLTCFLHVVLADEIRMLLLRGFNIIGALFVGDGNWETCAWKAVEASSKMRKFLFGDGDCDLIGAVTDLITDDIHFFVSHSTNVESMEAVSTVVFEDNPETYVWEKGCLLRCELELKLPVFVPLDKTSGAFFFGFKQ